MDGGGVIPYIAPMATPWLASQFEIRNRLPPGTKLIAGTLVFKREATEQGNSLKILLLRRASTDSYPLSWEHSAGKADPDDPSLIHTAIRELREETALAARSVLAAVGAGRESASYAENSTTQSEHEVDIGIGKILLFKDSKQQFWAKATFLVEVDGYEVALDENEHIQWRFVSEAEVINEKYTENGQIVQLDLISGGLKDTILQGFRLQR